MSKRGYTVGSIIVALIGIGIVVWLIRRKPGVIDKSEFTYFFETTVPDVSQKPVEEESDVARMVRISNAAIAADDAEEFAKL